ncbi:MAG: hypothetical protein ACRDH9_09765 [Actinomycetota bacterium]
MGILLAGVGAVSAVVLVGLMIAFARRLSDLTKAMTALQKELMPALDAIRESTEDTKRLAATLEERAALLRPDRG